MKGSVELNMNDAEKLRDQIDDVIKSYEPDLPMKFKFTEVRTQEVLLTTAHLEEMDCLGASYDEVCVALNSRFTPEVFAPRTLYEIENQYWSYTE